MDESMINFSNNSILVENYFNNQSKLLSSIILIVTGTVLLTLSAKIAVPFYPVPMTLQTLLVLFIGLTYGRILAPLTVALYLFQGAIGLPVFANGGGVVYLLGPTGGYLIGFLVAVIILSHLSNIGWNRNYALTLVSLMVGTITIFSCGLLQLSIVLNKTIADSMLLGLTPFIYGETFKILILLVLIPLVSKKNVS
ncbi:MAG: BioY family protein [Rhodobiaceae bacterium]|nr:BioY family protein [Rhodobiaceae bacterium]|tara:strand:- start:749 stop:1336 length:588 start_codon:yes stop_codon:yes gene_type:complete